MKVSNITYCSPTPTIHSHFKLLPCLILHSRITSLSTRQRATGLHGCEKKGGTTGDSGEWQQYHATLWYQNVCLSPALSKSTQYAFLFDNLKVGSLLSIGQLCDDDYIVIFTKYNVKIVKNNTIIVISKWNANDIWDIPLTPTPPPPPSVTKIKQFTHIPPSQMAKRQVNGVLRAQHIKQDLAKYLSGTLFNLRPSTLLRTIWANSLLTFTGLTICSISKYIPPVEASLKIYLAQEQKICAP